MPLDFQKLLLPVPRTAVFQMEGWYVWCGSAVKGEDGRYYLFFSRWLKSHGFDAWVSASQVCCAVADSPLGPFRYGSVVLEGAGGDLWDADCVHNPTVIRVDGRYYMYYMGNYGNGEFWNHRNHQRVGVAVAEHPLGPWKRFDRPVVDVTPGSFDSLMTSNPTAAQGPDGKIYLVYKAVGDGPLPKGGRVICGVAVSESPLGPFVKQPRPVMINPENDWSVEDPFIWCQQGRFYALVKDFQGYFTQTGRNTVALFESADGIDWNPAEKPLAFNREFHWEDGSLQKLARLERPQLLLEDGVPTVLYCAAAVEEPVTDSFNVHIPLRH